MKKSSGTLALVGGGEWQPPCRDLDAALLERAGTDEVLVVPTAAAFERPGDAVERATRWFEELGARVTALDMLNRRDAEHRDIERLIERASFVYLADGSPLHLRSVIKGSAAFDALTRVLSNGGVVAASGAGATVLCDPMVDPRGGAYTVGLGLVQGLAVFPYHGTAAEHMRERSIELLPREAVLAGLDEYTALVRSGAGSWEVIGPGTVTLYHKDAPTEKLSAGDAVPLPV